MHIRQLTVRELGAVSLYETALDPGLNILGSRHTAELSAAIGFLLCSRSIPPDWIRPSTRLAAEVLANAQAYTVTATACNGRLTLTARDPKGADVTEAYAYLLSHCPEQDALEAFDGQDKTLPLRLSWYRHWEDGPEDLSGKTQRSTGLKTFHAHLIRYIRAFRPQPIHCQKAYLVTLNPRGQFEAVCPGVSGSISLSETEEKLFLYLCFLNIAAFWAEIEGIRDLHHEKKPLVIRNLLEFLDPSADIRGLLDRTKKLRRQVILLTLPK